MAKEHKPGFIYILSDELKQEVALSEKSGWLICEDGVRYSPKELSILKEANARIDIFTHRVKKIIGGEVVSVERTRDEGKGVERTIKINKPDSTNPGVKVSGAHGVSAYNRAGELEIY